MDINPSKTLAVCGTSSGSHFLVLAGFCIADFTISFHDRPLKHPEVVWSNEWYDGHLLIRFL